MHAQRKGKRGEDEAAEALTAIFGMPCRRASGKYLPGFIAPDIEGLPGIHIEVKRREHLNMTDAMRQAKRDTGAGEVATVIHRPRRASWMLTVELQDAPALVEKLSRICSREQVNAAQTDDHAMTHIKTYPAGR